MRIFLLLILCFMIASSMSFGQTIFNEDFGSGTFPPSGWTIDANAANWSERTSQNAGGSAPEARFSWSPQFNGDSRLISSTIDLTGVTNLKVGFKYNVDHYGGAYTIGVATRSGGGSWNVVWEIVNPTSSVSATTEYVTINNSDVGAVDFQICWFFSGDSYNINHWYIDDCRLLEPYAHDIWVKGIPIDGQYVPGNTVTPQADVNNFGINSETFDVTCEIKIAGSSVYNQTCSPVTLAPDAEQTITFPDYTASASNELFEMIVTSNLSGDMDSTNNTQAKWLNTYTTVREMVVLEIGTGTWCQYCPGAAMGADDLIANNHDVAVVEYHNGDTFVNSYSDARNTYYGITGFPTAVFGGVDYVVGGSNTQTMYPTYLPIYQVRKVINSAFTVGIFGENIGLDYNLNIVVDKMATIPADWTNLVLHLALTESDIQYSWQGQTELHFVERLMAPDENGTAIDMIANYSQEVNLSFSIDASWQTQHCELVAFIQNLDTKEILQGSKVALTLLSPMGINDKENVVRVFKLEQNYPNPFNPGTYIAYELPTSSFVNLTIYNNLGQEVRTLVDNISQPNNQYKVYWNGKDDSGKDVSSGVYYYILVTQNANKVFEQSRKMLLIK